MTVAIVNDPVAAGISPQRLQETVAALAGLGRKLPGSESAATACRFICEQLASAGVANEVLQLDAFVSWPVKASLTVAGAVLPANGSAFTASADKLSGRVTRSLEPADLNGAFLVIDGLPRYDACISAQKAGALGVIAISHGPQRHYVQASPLWGAPTGPADLALLPSVPAIQVSQDATAVLEQAIASGAQVTMTSDIRTEWRAALQPVGEIEGREPGYVLLGAHYCTWGDGATDNTAGVALLIELARLLKQQPKPRYGVKFAFWTGHEQGGYAGSSWYADAFRDSLHRDAIAYLNVDIVGSRGGTTKALRNTTAELSDYVRQVLDGTVGKQTQEEEDFVDRSVKRLDPYIDPRRSARNSDQSFSGIGLATAQVSAFLPAASPDHLHGSGLAWWWHTDQDTIEHMDADVLAIDTLIYRNLVAGLIDAPALPFKPAAMARDVLAGLRAYREAAPALDDIARLTDLAEKLSDGLAGWAPTAADDRVLLRLGRHLNPVLYHARSAFEFDLGRASRILPGLAAALTLDRLGADAARMARVQLRQRANRIAHGLSEAIDLVEAARNGAL